MVDYINDKGQQINIPNNSGNVEINLSAKKDINLNINIPKKLVSRDEMLAKLQNEYDNGNNCVVISGLGGSGKTSLAYLYAQKQDFDHVAWVTVNSKIIDDFLQTMAAELFEDADYNNFIQNKNQNAKLKNIINILSAIKGNNLLVFDINTDNEEIKREIENEIHNYLPVRKNWKTIVLTRVPAKNKDWFATIPIETMSEEIAIKIFNKNYDGDVDFTDKQLAEIVEKLHYHPLLIEHTAKVYTDEFDITAEEIVNQIDDNIVNNDLTKKDLSGLAKDGKEQQDINTYLTNLCNIKKLSEAEVKFLAVFVTWPEEPIDYEVIDTLLPNQKDTLNNLIKKGIIRRNKQFSIHSLMADVLRKQINIKEFDYTEYFDTIQKFADVKCVTLHKYSKYIASSFINYGICGNVNMFIYFLNLLCTNNDVILYNLPEPEFSNIVKKLEENADPNQLARLYNAVARAEECITNLADAKLHFDKALGIMQRVENNEETLGFKGALLQNLAMLKEDLGDSDSAKKHYELSLEIFRQLPETPQYLYCLETNLGNLADLEKKIDDTDSAKKHFVESVKIGRKLPETSLYLNRLSITLHNLADLEENLDDTSSAKKHYEESLEIKRQLPETPQYLDSLATTLNNLANLEVNLDNTDSAKMHFEESLETYRKLPETPKYLDNCANALVGLAKLEEKLGDKDSAKNHYEESLEIRRKLPETPLYLDKMTLSLAGLAMHEETLGDINFAKKHYEEGLVVSRKINNEGFKKFFEEKLSSL